MTRIAGIVLAGLAATAAGAQEGNVDAGRALAEEYCVRCHNISPGGPMKQHPPSLAAIARFRPENQIVARIWFPSVHYSMPPMASLLEPQNVADLTAFILSLE
jgi:mono/diheme cytochrome c family protein